MEDEMGFALFVRSKSGVVPTENAKRLIPMMRAQLSWDEQIEQEIAQINALDRGTLTIASYASIASQWLPAVIKSFNEDYPAIKINIIEGVWQDVASYLNERRADMGFYSYHPSIKYHWIPLKNDPVVVAVPPEHPLADKSHIKISDLANEKLIRTAGGFDVDVGSVMDIGKHDSSYTTLLNYSAFAMVEKNMGLVITNRLITHRLDYEMKLIPLDPPQNVSLGIAYPTDVKLSPAAEMFIKYSKRIIPELD